MFDARRLLDQVITGVQGQAAGLQRPGESLTDTAKRYLDQGAAATGLEGQGKGLAAGAIAGGALALLLGSKSVRKVGGSAIKVGGLALVAGLAYKAWNQYQAGPNPAETAIPPVSGVPGLISPPKESPFNPDATPGGAEGRAADLLVAMIAAAKADGHIDVGEKKRIFDHLDDFGLDPEAKAFVMAEIEAPLDVERIVRMAKTPAVATQLYAASLLAMNPDTPAERAYLDLLAARLGLDKGLVSEIERAAAAAAEPA